MSNEISNYKRPEYLSNVSSDDLDTSTLNKFRRVPRVKIIQGTTEGELGDQFNQGDTVIIPDNVLVAPNKSTFVAVPILTFEEWAVWNPWELVKSGQLEPIAKDEEGNVLISTNPSSDIAQKARERHSEPCEIDNTQFLTWQSHLNYVLAIFIEGDELPTYAMQVFRGAEFRTGSNWANRIRATIERKKVPQFCQRYLLTVAKHSNDKGNWMGFDIKPDLENPYVTGEEYELFKEENRISKEQLKNALLGTDYSDAPSANTKVSEDSEF